MKKALLLKTLASSYAMMTVHECKKSDELWYKQAQQVNKYFMKRKPKPVPKDISLWLENRYADAKQLDMEYFKDKTFSSYVCMILILDYLIYEMRDIEMRSKFLHIDTRKSIKELDSMDWIKECNNGTNRYVSKILELLEK